MRIEATARLRSTLQTVVDAAANDVADLMRQLKDKLTDAHIDATAFDASVHCTGSLDGILDAMTEAGWDVNSSDEKHADVSGNDFSDLELKADGDEHVTISLR